MVAGILAIMEAEEELSVVKRMLAHYRSVYRDMQNHGFEAAKWVSGVVLSLLEKGKLTWSQEEKMAEERRSALTAAANPPRESLPPPQRQFRNSQGNSFQPSLANNNARSGSGGNRKLTKACVFYNHGSCPHPSHHEAGNTRWQHVCRKCWEPGHFERDCPAN
jgi:hypothetical protein